jgi:hypothetical protein
MEMVVGEEWAEVRVGDTKSSGDLPSGASGGGLEGTVSAHFREMAWAPYVKLIARDSKACLSHTTFLASEVQ